MVGGMDMSFRPEQKQSNTSFAAQALELPRKSKASSRQIDQNFSQNMRLLKCPVYMRQALHNDINWFNLF